MFDLQQLLMSLKCKKPNAEILQNQMLVELVLKHVFAHVWSCILSNTRGGGWGCMREKEEWGGFCVCAPRGGSEGCNEF